MEFEEYKSLLERARSQLPESVFKTERFEMPIVRSIIVGNKTIIKRFNELCKIINRDPKHLMKYFAKELGTHGELQGTDAIFQGKFSNIMINKKFERYVQDFVLCHECGKPDTKIIRKGRTDILKCEACGARRTVEKIR